MRKIKSLVIYLHPRNYRDFIIIRENIKCDYSFFTLSQDDNKDKTLITKNGFYILRTVFTMGYKTGQKILSASTWAY